MFSFALERRRQPRARSLDPARTASISANISRVRSSAGTFEGVAHPGGHPREPPSRTRTPNPVGGRSNPSDGDARAAPAAETGGASADRRASGDGDRGAALGVAGAATGEDGSRSPAPAAVGGIASGRRRLEDGSSLAAASSSSSSSSSKSLRRVAARDEGCSAFVVHSGVPAPRRERDARTAAAMESISAARASCASFASLAARRRARASRAVFARRQKRWILRAAESAVETRRASRAPRQCFWIVVAASACSALGRAAGGAEDACGDAGARARRRGAERGEGPSRGPRARSRPRRGADAGPAGGSRRRRRRSSARSPRVVARRPGPAPLARARVRRLHVASAELRPRPQVVDAVAGAEGRIRPDMMARGERERGTGGGWARTRERGCERLPLERRVRAPSGRAARCPRRLTAPAPAQTRVGQFSRGDAGSGTRESGAGGRTRAAARLHLLERAAIAASRENFFFRLALAASSDVERVRRGPASRLVSRRVYLLVTGRNPAAPFATSALARFVPPGPDPSRSNGERNAAAGPCPCAGLARTCVTSFAKR